MARESHFSSNAADVFEVCCQFFGIFGDLCYMFSIFVLFIFFAFVFVIFSHLAGNYFFNCLP